MKGLDVQGRGQYCKLVLSREEVRRLHDDYMWGWRNEREGYYDIIHEGRCHYSQDPRNPERFLCTAFESFEK